MLSKEDAKRHGHYHAYSRTVGGGSVAIVFAAVLACFDERFNTVSILSLITVMAPCLLILNNIVWARVFHRALEHLDHEEKQLGVPVTVVKKWLYQSLAFAAMLLVLTLSKHLGYF